MTTASRPLIEFDAASFDPTRILPVRHNLAGHPLLALPRLRELARRLPAKQVRFHATTARAGSDFERATEEHRPALSLDDALANMENAGSWIALHNVQTDPAYRALLDEALDKVKGRIDAKDPGMFNRAFWIFVQSPRSVTPFHMDHEQNFLLQIQGRKTARVWHPEDCLTDYTLEVFHSEYTRKEVAYKEEWNDTAHRFELEPGLGVYMPFTGPHLVNNLDNVSITVSMTYCTEATRRVETIYRGNHALRRLGVQPAPVGLKPVRDGLKHAAFRSYLTTRAWLRGKDPRLPDWVVQY